MTDATMTCGDFARSIPPAPEPTAHYERSLLMGRMPTEGWRPRGGGQADLRGMLGFASRRAETLEWRWDDGETRHSSTNNDMFHGNVEALGLFGIGRDHRIERTGLPLSFLVVDPDGRERTLSFRWDGSEDDMMSLPPHVVPWNGYVRAAAVAVGGIALWAAIVGGAAALGLL